MSFFDSDTLHKLLEAATQTGLYKSRDALFAGIHPAFRGELQIANAPGAQLLSDLTFLNTTLELRDGTVPFEIWLRNAQLLTSPRVESQVFESALQSLLQGRDVQIPPARVKPEPPDSREHLWLHVNAYDNLSVNAIKSAFGERMTRECKRVELKQFLEDKNLSNFSEDTQALYVEAMLKFVQYIKEHIRTLDVDTVFISGQAPLGFFALLGVVTSKWGRPVVFANLHPASDTFDVIEFGAVEKHAARDYIQRYDGVLDDVVQSKDGWLGVFASSKVSPSSAVKKDIGQMFRKLGEKQCYYIGLQAKMDVLHSISQENGPGLAHELNEHILNVMSSALSYERRGIFLFLEGSIQWAYLVGRTLNPKTAGPIQLFEFERGKGKGYRYLIGHPLSSVRSFQQLSLSNASGTEQEPSIQPSELERRFSDVPYVTRAEIMTWIRALECIAFLTVDVFEEGQKKSAKSHGTGWLISKRVLATCYHVIAARDGNQQIKEEDLIHQVAGMRVWFDYSCEKGAYSPASVERLLAYDSELDIAFILLSESIGERDFLPVRAHRIPSSSTGYNERVTIVHHGAGGSSRVSLPVGRVVDSKPQNLRYQTDTEKGTSGAPVLDSNGHVTALHIAGGAQSNMGLQMEYILRWLQRDCNKEVLSSLKEQKMKLIGE